MQRHDESERLGKGTGIGSVDCTMLKLGDFVFCRSDIHRGISWDEGSLGLLAGVCACVQSRIHSCGLFEQLVPKTKLRHVMLTFPANQHPRFIFTPHHHAIPNVLILYSGAEICPSELSDCIYRSILIAALVKRLTRVAGTPRTVCHPTGAELITKARTSSRS